MKKSLTFILSSLICLAFIGCSDDSKNNTNQNPPPSTPNTPQDPTQQTPPAENPGQQTPPAENPGQQTPPAENPGQQTPPAENPGQQTPPTENPGQQTPPAENPGQQTPPAENPDDTNPYQDKTGQACTEPLYEKQYVYDCVNNKYELFIDCGEGKVGYTEYVESEEDYVAGCYEPCAKAELDKTKTGCYGGELGYFQGSLECMQMVENLYVYNINLEKLDEMIACPGECQNDKCATLASDEGSACDNAVFKTRCDGSVLVTCEEGVVVTEKCDFFEDDDMTCAQSADGSFTGCVSKTTCATPEQTKYECYKTTESLFAQTCKTAKDGKNYYFDDLAKSVLYECPVCNEQKGTCSK